MRGHSLARHAVDVLTILVLGFVYLVVLSIGTALTAGRDRFASVFATNGPVEPRSEETPRHSH